MYKILWLALYRTYTYYVPWAILRQPIAYIYKYDNRAVPTKQLETSNTNQNIIPVSVNYQTPYRKNGCDNKRKH